jgi:YfiH family protein
VSGSEPPVPGLPRPFELCRGVNVLVTERAGGLSSGPFATLNLSAATGDDPEAVRGNRALAQRALGPGPARLAWMRQVHGAGVTRVAPGGEDPGPNRPPADAIFTESPQVALGALVADCAPVLLADPVAGLVGAAHAGRQGMVAGVVPALLAAMTRAGAEPRRMSALIGPAICGLCYEVPAAMRAEVAAAVPESWCLTRKNTPGVDLRAGLRAQLDCHGVARIADDPRCPAESAELFSHRRDGLTGRFAGVIWLTAG